MPSVDLLITFFLAFAIFARVPGSSMLYAAAQTMASGRRAGWCSAVGFHLAGFGHIVAAAFGISTLLQMMPALFVVMKAAGATYLIWLGVTYLKSRAPLVQLGNPTSNPQAAKTLKDSIVVEALNPKSALFFLAFLPQFTDTSASLPIWAQVVVLGTIANVMFTITDAVLIEMAHATMRRLKTSERAALVLERVGGGILVALGLNLAFARQ